MIRNPVMEAEVEWYRRFGKFPQDRIKRDSTGAHYVIGDWSWNRGNLARSHEIVEPDMKRSISPTVRADPE